MPLLNGLDLIQEIRNRSLNVPIVILSGYNDFSYAKKALKLGVFDYLLKPIDPEELSNTLGKLKQLYANTVKEQQQHFFHQFAVGRRYFSRAHSSTTPSSKRRPRISNVSRRPSFVAPPEAEARCFSENLLLGNSRNMLNMIEVRSVFRAPFSERCFCFFIIS